LNAHTRLEVAKTRSAALIKEANAEGANSSKMEGMRRHEEKMEAAKVLNSSSQALKVVIAGKNG
jgi:hypothetical protein